MRIHKFRKQTKRATGGEIKHGPYDSSAYPINQETIQVLLKSQLDILNHLQRLQKKVNCQQQQIEELTALLLKRRTMYEVQNQLNEPTADKEHQIKHPAYSNLYSGQERRN